MVLHFLEFLAVFSSVERLLRNYGRFGEVGKELSVGGLVY